MDKIAEKESLIKYLEENGLYMVKKTDFEPLTKCPVDLMKIIL